MLVLLALNSLGKADTVFFIVLAAIVALCIAIYFLIPVFNRKQYREQRENLKKREVAFKSNVRRTDGTQMFAAEDEEETEETEPSAVEVSAEPPIDPTNFDEE